MMVRPLVSRRRMARRALQDGSDHATRQFEGGRVGDRFLWPKNSKRRHKFFPHRALEKITSDQDIIAGIDYPYIALALEQIGKRVGTRAIPLLDV
jgi:hypothetical protein